MNAGLQDLGTNPTSTCTVDPRFKRWLTYAFASSSTTVRFEDGLLHNQALLPELSLQSGDPRLVDLSELPDRVILRPDPSGIGLFSRSEQVFPHRQASLVLVAEAEAEGLLLALAPFDFNNQALRLSAEASGELCAEFWTSPQDGYRSCLDPGGPGRVVVTLVLNPDQDPPLEFTVDDQRGEVQTRGIPGLVGQLDRTLFVGPGLESNFAWSELQFYRSALKGKELWSLVKVIAADHNLSLTGGAWQDIDCVGEEDHPSPRFLAARAVLDERCISCHDGTHNSWAGQPERYFTAANLVVPGLPLESRIYYRIRNSEGQNGPKTMPLEGTVTSEERATLRSWIEEL